MMMMMMIDHSLSSCAYPVVVFIPQIHICEAPGDILVFLTGEEEIEDACRQIREEAANYEESHGELVVYPLYSTLPPALQQKIFLVGR